MVQTSARRRIRKIAFEKLNDSVISVSFSNDLAIQIAYAGKEQHADKVDLKLIGTEERLSPSVIRGT